MKRKLWILLALLFFLAVIGWAFYPKPLEVDTARLRSGMFERRIEEDGRTRLRERFVVSAPVAGRLERVILREGDPVMRGQVIATLWPAAPALLDERRLREQREQVAAAEARLGSARATAASAEAALAQAEADLERNRTLAARGFIAPSRLEAVRLATELRRKELEAASQQADAAQHQLAQLRVALRGAGESAQSQAQAWPVRSPVDGRILRVRQQSEAVLPVGTPLVEVGDPARMEVLVDLLTEDAALVSAGMPATLQDWGGGTVLEARVRLVEPSAFTKVSALGVEEQRVNVLLDIITPSEQWQTLGDNYKVDVSIPVLGARDVTLVPVGAVFPRGSRSAVFVLDDGRARLEEVELVARNGREAWIRTPLAPGTVVVTYPPVTLKDGDRVRPLVQ